MRQREGSSLHGTKPMAQFSWSMQIIKRSTGRSVVAAAAYRAGAKLHDERAQTVHDYTRRTGVDHAEIIAPDDAPSWVYDRETLWNKVEASEKRKDAQLARELRVMVPREIPPSDRVTLLRDYVARTFVARGMVADVAWHNKIASDGQEQPHAHILLTMRPLTSEGFGKKSRHDYVRDPEGRTHADGKPVLVMSNEDSWNCPAYFERCREAWETTANAALERAGTEARIDRRSLLERGIARMPEPALRMAWYMKDLYGGMKKRFGQYIASKEFRRVEEVTRAAIAKLETGQSRYAQRFQMVERFYQWAERQIDRLQPAPEPARAPSPAPGIDR